MTPLRVVAFGLCTPLGLDRETTVREVAAGTDRFAETEIVDQVGQPVRACALPLLPRGATRTERMVALAQSALDEPLAAAARLGAERVRLTLGLPEPDGAAPYDADPLLAMIRGRALEFGITVELVPADVARTGRASFFAALEAAGRRMSRDEPLALVGAVDSRCDTTSLIRLATAGRTLGETNLQGMLPGEGAGFALVTGRRTGVMQSARLPEIVGLATGQEPQPFVNARTKPSLAAGLTGVMRALRTHEEAGARRPERVLSCQTDASFWGTEVVRAYLRNTDIFPEPLRIDLVSEALGDPGAAAGPVQVAMAIDLSATENVGQPDPRARMLVYGSADTGPVGACVLEGDPARPLLVSGRPEGLEPPALWEHEDAEPYLMGFVADHVEDLGSLVLQRGATLRAPTEPWAELESLERRIGAKLDAVAARGDRGPRFARGRIEDDEDDEELRAGSLLVLAAMGTEADRAMLGERWAALDEAALDDWVDALSLGLRGHDARPLAVGLTDADSPPRRTATRRLMEALGQRPAPELRAALRLAPAAEPEHDALLALLAGAPDPALRQEATAICAEDPSHLPRLELLLAMGHAQALPLLRHRAEGQDVDPKVLELLAMAGDRREQRRFFDLAQQEAPHPTLLRALGIYGLAGAVPTLLEALERGDEAAHEAALALHRITGAGLRTERWQPDEDAEDPALEGEALEVLDQDPAAWRAWWSTHGGRFSDRARYRRGEGHAPRRVLDELADPSSHAEVRQLARRELAIQISATVDLSASWPVAIQREALSALRPAVGGQDEEESSP